MGLFGNKTKKLKAKVEQMESSLERSFQKVRNDIDTANAWINYYYQRSLYFESQINRSAQNANYINSQLASSQSSINTHSKLISELTGNMQSVMNKLSSLHSSANTITKDELNFHIENISRDLHAVDKKVEHLSFLPAKVDSMKHELQSHISSPHRSRELEEKLNTIQEKLKNIIAKKSPKQKLVEKVSKNSHDYIKAVVLSYIKKYQKISAFQLREMVVEEQNLTSKSTFYRILEEIEKSEELSIVWQGKEKLYISKLSKTA
jgi:hypothetical protein